jgi:CBS domain-containing protein
MICPTCGFDNVPGSEQCQECECDLAPLDLPKAHDRVERSLMDDPVKVACPRTAVTLPPTAPVGEAIRTMLENNCGAVLIVDDSGHTVGILTERDILTKAVDPSDHGFEIQKRPGWIDPLTRPIADFMTPTPEAVRETHTLAFALHKMDTGGYRHLPVLREGRPVAMISVRDMIRHITLLCAGG